MAAAPRHDDLKLHLHVLGEDHELSARARVGPTRVTEVLPLAREIADGLVRIALEKSAAEGQEVSCRKGCTSCCHQLVPLSPAEAVRLAEVVEAMPKERRRAVKKRFEKAVKRMEEVGLVDARAARGRSALLSAAATGGERWDDASRRYFAAHVPCPLLEDDACVAYAERPMGCREYHVTTPAALCETLDPGLHAVPRPVYMSDALTGFTNEALGRADAAVPLPLALEWASVHARAFAAEGDGETLAMALVQHIQAEDDADP